MKKTVIGMTLFVTLMQTNVSLAWGGDQPRFGGPSAGNFKTQSSSFGDWSSDNQSFGGWGSAQEAPQAQAKSRNLRESRVSVPSVGPVHSKGTVVFDPNNRSWGAYDETGSLVKSGRASGGKNYCPDVGRRCHTPIGKFTVYNLGDKSCVSQKYPLGEGGAPMPFCMFFHGGYALHGSYDVPNYNASHGCIRLVPSSAEWLRYNFVKRGTVVVVRPYRQMMAGDNYSRGI